MVKESLARADERGSLPAKLFSVYFLFLIPFFPFRLFHFILFADSFPLCEDFAIMYSSNLFVCVRVCVCACVVQRKSPIIKSSTQVNS